jgi:hypothetical protein
VTVETNCFTTTRVVRLGGVPDTCGQKTSHVSSPLTLYDLRMKEPAAVHSRNMQKRIQDIYYYHDDNSRLDPNVMILNTILICSFTADEERLLSRWKCAVIELKKEHQRMFFLELLEYVHMDHPAIRQSFVSVLELAELMDCSDMLVLVERQRSDLASLVRSFMYIGFRTTPPNSLVYHHPDHMVLHYKLS